MSKNKKKPASVALPGEEYAVDSIKNQKFDRIPDNSGVGQTPRKKKNPKFIEALNNYIIRHNGGEIVFGGDRPSGLESGTAGAGFYKNSTIDIVVGRASKNIDLEDIEKRGLSAGDDYNYVGNLFTRDAARVYISESTLIDKNFGLAFGPRQPAPGKNNRPVSAIGVKADVVRVIGTENVNIVTGPARNFSGKKETNTLGGKVSNGGTINLIAGNYTDPKIYLRSPRTPGESVIHEAPYLQPAIKGDFLVNCLNEIINYIDAVETGIYNMCLAFSKSDALIAAASPNPPVSALLLKRASITNLWGSHHLYTARKSGLNLRKNFLTYGHDQHIRSPNVYLT
tara:strand:+ start:510 stop:1529 length:1020 start_codon:yes stop_codon:yes gene_type:complete